MWVVSIIQVIYTYIVMNIRGRYVALLVIILLNLAGLVGVIVVLRQRTDVYSRPQAASVEVSSSSDVFIATHESSSETEVEASVIAQKVDLQRKLIVPQSLEDKATIEAMVQQAGGSIVKSNTSAIVVEIPKQAEGAIVQQLQQQELAQSVEVDYPVYLAADSVDWGIEKIEVPPVWEVTQGAGITVAVVDTGIDYTHSDLQGRYIGGYDFVNDDADPKDDHGHGTHVAGVIAAGVNNSGTQGIASSASLVAIKVLGADGSGYVSDIIDAVDWAIEQRVHVMNFSLGTPHHSAALESKLQEAQSRGIVLVAAAGNTNGGTLMYPAAYAPVISVAATDQNDNFASFSSVGAEIAAPGVGITSTVPGGGYATWSGTSMAAPHVSASVALMLANGQTNIRERLHQTALDLGEAGRDAYFGHGRIIGKPAVLGEDVLSAVVAFLEPKHNSNVPSSVQVILDIQDESDVVEATLSANNTVITRWTEPPYIFTWDASLYTGQDVMLIASAVDSSGNIGAAQVSVAVVDVATVSPSFSPTPSARVATPSVFPRFDRSDDVRQDAKTPSQQRRQDGERASEGVPPVTNINQRNPVPVPVVLPPQARQQQQEQSVQQNESAPRDTPASHRGQADDQDASRGTGGRPDVRGASVDGDEWGWWILLKNWLQL